MLSFVQFGAGFIGAVHAANIAAHPRATLKSIVDVVPEAGAKLAREHGAEFRADPEEAVNDPAVDAVLIASDGRTHAELVTLACRAGKAIFCEKPLDLDVVRAEACAKAAAAAGVPFQIGFHRRFDPGHRAVRDALDGGEIGAVELVSITTRGGDPEIPPRAYFEKTPDCIWKDMLIHELDVARWLLGEEPIEVYAAASNLVAPALAELGEPDTAMLILKTASGAMCQISASFRAVSGYDQRLEVFGSKAMVALDNLRPTPVERRAGEAEGVRRASVFVDFMSRYRECYRVELDAFIGALESGAAPSPGLDDGLRAIRLADAASRSHRGGAPVKVPA